MTNRDPLLAALVAVMLALTPPAFAAGTMASSGDAMMSGESMAPMDPMAEDCIAKADAETDMMKMDAMMADCATSYPEAVAAHCMLKADMETDAMKHDEMSRACQEKYPGMMSSAM